MTWGGNLVATLFLPSRKVTSMTELEIVSCFQYCTTILEVQEVYKRLIVENQDNPSVCDDIYKVSSQYESGKRSLYVPKPEDKLGLSVPNYKAFRLEQKLGNWRDFWVDELPLGDNVGNIVDKFVKLPARDIQLPVVVAYNTLNLPLLNKAPILYLYGGEGSGKSTLAKLCGCFNGSFQDGKIFQSSSTFASIRNYIQDNRTFKVYDPETHEALEKSLCLTWDDVTPELLVDPRIMNLMKAYDRSTANIQIANSSEAQGSNQSFFVFALKILTSVSPIFHEYRFRELSRRCFFIKCARQELGLQLEEGEDLPQVEDYEWKGMELELYKYWHGVAVQEYANELKYLKKPPSVSYAQWEISRSLVASGLVHNVWSTSTEALDNIAEYWKWFEKTRMSTMTAAQQKTQAIIESWVTSEATNEAGLQEVIDAQFIQTKLKEASIKGELNESITAKKRTELMLTLGWRMERKGHTIVYVPNV